MIQEALCSLSESTSEVGGCSLLNVLLYILNKYDGVDEGNVLVIHSKVSLTAYDRHCALPPDDPERRVHAQAHLRSLRKHVADIASKNYTRLYQISSQDYLLLFVHIEPAFGLA